MWRGVEVRRGERCWTDCLIDRVGLRCVGLLRLEVMCSGRGRRVRDHSVRRFVGSAFFSSSSFSCIVDFYRLIDGGEVGLRSVGMSLTATIATTVTVAVTS